MSNELVGPDIPPSQREKQFFREEPTQLARDLAFLLNSYSRENASNTPDFILARGMLDLLDAAEALIRRRDCWYGVELAPGRQLGGLKMGLYFNDADPVAECECGWRSQGDAINDAVLAWTKHVTSTPACREKL